MNNKKLIKLMNSYDEDFKLSDYSVSDLEEMSGIKKNQNINFKQRYFDFYDDVKSSSLKKQDW